MRRPAWASTEAACSSTARNPASKAGQFAHIVGGAQDGNSYELAWLGNMAYENVVANAHTGNKTVVAVTDDGQNGQVYFYAGDKKATGNAVEQAGLTGGHLLGIHVTELEGVTNNNEPNTASPLGADEKSTFTMVDLGDVSGMTGAQIDAASEAAGVTTFPSSGRRRLGYRSIPTASTS